jgi:hypothetical protein
VSRCSLAHENATTKTRNSRRTYFWTWLHGDDPKTAARAYIAIARALLADIDALTGEPRRRAEGFVVDGGAGRPLGAFSRTSVEERLEALERDIR